MDLILTVIVGILGAVIGLFFGGMAEQHIKEPRKQAILSSTNANQELILKTKKLIDIVSKIKEDKSKE